jgi:hypothetical protein
LFVGSGSAIRVEPEFALVHEFPMRPVYKYTCSGEERVRLCRFSCAMIMTGFKLTKLTCTSCTAEERRGVSGIASGIESHPGLGTEGELVGEEAKLNSNTLKQLEA